MRSKSAKLIVVILVSLLAACSQHVVLSDRFPSPVIDPIPAAVTLYLPPGLKNYTHKEKPEQGVDWTIEFRQANVRLFESVMHSLFEPLTVVDSLDGVPDNATVITPVMLDYQFSTPGQSKTEYFEVWIKYKLQLYHPKGELLHEWPFTAYGRDSESGKSDAQALKEATRRAMRDAAAAVVVGYLKAPTVKRHFTSSESGA